MNESHRVGFGRLQPIVVVEADVLVAQGLADGPRQRCFTALTGAVDEHGGRVDQGLLQPNCRESDVLHRRVIP